MGAWLIGIKLYAPNQTLAIYAKPNTQNPTSKAVTILGADSKTKLVLKYFAHGLLFELVAAFLSFWGLSAILGVEFPSLIIIFAVVIIATGSLNTMIARFLWNPSIQMSIVSIVVRGIVLFLGLVVINYLVVVLPQLVFPSMVTMIVSLVLATFLAGVVGKFAVAIWKK